MFEIKGSLDIPGRKPLASEVDRIYSMLANAISHQIANVTIHTTTPLQYSRPLLQGGFSNVNSFGSGEIRLSGHDTHIHVNYVLGIGPYLFSMCIVAASFLLFLLKGYPTGYVELAASICEMLIVGRLLYSVRATRQWLRNAILSEVPFRP